MKEYSEPERIFRLIVESAPNAFVMVNNKGQIILVNSQTEKYFGYDRSELLGQSVEILVPDRFRGHHPEYRANFLAKPEARAMGEGRDLFGRRKDGSEFPVEIGLNYIQTEKGVLVLSAIVDITERKKTEERLASLTRQLQESNAQLTRSNLELNDFAQITSHDLKEPLRGINSYAQFLIEDYGDKLDSEGLNKLKTLKALATRLSNLIDSLLEYSRVGRVDLAFQDTDLNVIIQEVAASLKITFQENGVSLRVPHSLPIVHCDRVRVAEVFRNLFTNAVKYNDKEKKWIEIGALQQGKSTVLFVRDNGIGIREKHLDSIFHIFRRLHGRDQFGGGTGVGLTIVKKIIEKHGGKIWAESTLGEGTSFYFTLAAER